MTGLATSTSATPSEKTGQKTSRALKIKRVVGLVVAILALVLVVLASLAIGTRDMPVSEVLGAFFDPSGSDDQLVVLELRLPRTVLGILVGMGLGLAGGLIQALTRNPLADPGILGVNAGASFAVTIGIGFFGVTSIGGYIWLAFLGALVATTGVY
ncbi:MAG: iron chelate uptake ABC transporter family permease subunit, partial [Brevibacterium sp.]|nr:iron chelate uptake ABC transporter family permease subunit [Brevibacterium sp.]